MPNNTSSTHFVEAAASLLATLRGNGAPRAVLVSLDEDGNPVLRPIVAGESIVQLSNLQDHLNARPLEPGYLEDLRDYCQGRLAAQAEACKTGGFVIPRAAGRWEIAHANAFQPVTVGGAQ